MNDAEASLVRHELASLTRRAEQAECSLREVARERDHLRALLTRLRTSLNEIQNDPVSDGRPVGALSNE
jgi:predicted  nucleic acid-binding Zn-ribbon protein